MLQQCSSNSSSFSFLFPMSGSMEEPSNYYSSSASVVDCTLSLATPSTRHTGGAPPMNRSSCGTPSFCWDIITQSKSQQAAASRVPSAYSNGNTNSSSSNLGGDSLLARRCANCDTTSTPLWRNGPRGPKSLCNACGIRYKKEERRAAASTASPLVNESIGYSNFQQQQQQQQQQYPWGCYPSTGTSSKSGSSWCQSDEDMDETTPYLSWRLNVVPPQFPVIDRPSLFQYQ